MQKGQISIDLIFAVIIALITIVSMGTILDSFNKNQQRMVIENEIRLSATGLTSLITSSQAIADMNFYSVVPLERVYYNGTESYPTATIDLDKNILTLTVSNNQINIHYDSNFSRKGTTNVTVENNLLVIKNAK